MGNSYTSLPYINNSIFIQYNKKEVHEFLGFYLAGLIEGDGYISITNQNRVILGIIFNIKDQPLAEKVLNLLGKGFIALHCIALQKKDKLIV